MLDPVPRRHAVCSRLFLPRHHRPSPSEDRVGFPRLSRESRLLAGPRFEDADIPLCSGLQVCSPPGRLYRCNYSAGQPGFYVRAYCASLPPHTPDMLTVRIQAIDGAGTYTLPDFQPCRLLTSLPGHYPGSTLLWSSPRLDSASVLSASWVATCAFSLIITDQGLKFRTKARIRVTPPAHR